jgi:antitoxin component of MazEF toxin-antitoxin module
MKVKVVQIGNSKGIRIPKKLLVQYKIGETVELKVEEGRVTLQPPLYSGAKIAQGLKKVDGRVPGESKGLKSKPWKNRKPLNAPGVSLSKMIIADRKESKS